MAGIALLSAINLVRNVSFMIFDESDAFLDAGNSYRFLRFIKNLSVNNDI
jgi:chromosome segregation ATPase